MSLNMTVWDVDGNNLKVIGKSKLDNESRLEDWVARDSSILGLDLLIIGRQVTTYFGGRIDLLAIDSQGDIVILELKRDKTPRDIVAQVLDYASWIDGLSPKDIDEIATAYLKENLTTAFNSHFGSALPEVIN
jgi:RecB family endonuclease NucS